MTDTVVVILGLGKCSERLDQVIRGVSETFKARSECFGQFLLGFPNVQTNLVSFNDSQAINALLSSDHQLPEELVLQHLHEMTKTFNAQLVQFILVLDPLQLSETACHRLYGSVRLLHTDSRKRENTTIELYTDFVDLALESKEGSWTHALLTLLKTSVPLSQHYACVSPLRQTAVCQLRYSKRYPQHSEKYDRIFLMDNYTGELNARPITYLCAVATISISLVPQHLCTKFFALDFHAHENSLLAELENDQALLTSITDSVFLESRSALLCKQDNIFSLRLLANDSERGELLLSSSRSVMNHADFVGMIRSLHRELWESARLHSLHRARERVQGSDPLDRFAASCIYKKNIEGRKRAHDDKEYTSNDLVKHFRGDDGWNFQEVEEFGETSLVDDGEDDYSTISIRNEEIDFELEHTLRTSLLPVSRSDKVYIKPASLRKLVFKTMLRSCNVNNLEDSTVDDVTTIVRIFLQARLDRSVPSMDKKEIHQFVQDETSAALIKLGLI